MLMMLVGLVAATLTSLSYIPQVKKAIPRGSTEDLSLKTLGALATGLGLWIAYGLLQADIVIVGANAAGAALVLTLIAFKLRDLKHARSSASR